MHPLPPPHNLWLVTSDISIVYAYLHKDMSLLVHIQNCCGIHKPMLMFCEVYTLVGPRCDAALWDSLVGHPSVGLL